MWSETIHFSRSILASKTITPTYLNPINTAEDLLFSQLNAICTPGTTNYLKATQKFQKMKNRIHPDLLNSLQENIIRFVKNIEYPAICSNKITSIINLWLTSYDAILTWLNPLHFIEIPACRAKEGEFVIVADKNWGSMNGLHTGRELIAAKHTSPIIQKNNPMKESLNFHPWCVD